MQLTQMLQVGTSVIFSETILSSCYLQSICGRVIWSCLCLAPDVRARRICRQVTRSAESVGVNMHCVVSGICDCELQRQTCVCAGALRRPK